MSKNKWSATEKFKIALLAIKGDETIEAICQKHHVAASQVYAWKKQLMEQGAELFGKAPKLIDTTELDKKASKLYEKIGQLTVERDFLKKAWSKIHGKLEYDL